MGKAKERGEYLLGDEVQAKAVKIVHKGTVITVETVAKLILDYLKQVEDPKYGKQSLKKLNKKGKSLDTIPVTAKDLKGLERELRKYGVDYSVRKSTVEKDTFEIYFKGTDINQIQTGLRNYAADMLKRNERPSVKETIQKAIAKAKEKNANRPPKEKKMQRGKDER